MPCTKCKDQVDITDLSSLYIIHKCQACGREIKLKPIITKKGIKIENGRLVIPKEYLKISANPLKSRAYLTEAGVGWLANLIFVGDFLNKRDELDKELQEEANYCLESLRSSSLIKDLDIENPSHAEEIKDRLKENQYGIDWWTYVYRIAINEVQARIKEGDSIKAAWAMGYAQRCRSLIVFRREFEEAVWMGQSARQVIDITRIWNSNKENDKEDFWQEIFNHKPYILSQVFSVPVVFIQDKAYVGGMNIDKKDAKFIDFLYAIESSKESLLIEIKTPKTKLLGFKYRGIYRPSSEIVGAIIQTDIRQLLKNSIAITIG
jgi:hypothetical protein